MMTKEEIGKIIKNARIDAGLTQIQVASKLGRPQQTIANWEVGRSQPDANTLFELFKILGADLNTSFGFPPKAKASLSTAEAVPGEEQLMSLYRDLNDEGREKLVDYADDLVSSGKYIKSNPDKLGNEKLA